MKCFFCGLVFFLTLLAGHTAGQMKTDTLQTKILDPIELNADFNYLRRLLVETHPGLYRYSSKAQIQSRFDSIGHLLD